MGFTCLPPMRWCFAGWRMVSLLHRAAQGREAMKKGVQVMDKGQKIHRSRPRRVVSRGFENSNILTAPRRGYLVPLSGLCMRHHARNFPRPGSGQGSVGSVLEGRGRRGGTTGGLRVTMIGTGMIGFGIVIGAGLTHVKRWCLKLWRVSSGVSSHPAWVSSRRHHPRPGAG